MSLFLSQNWTLQEQLSPANTSHCVIILVTTTAFSNHHKCTEDQPKSDEESDTSFEEEVDEDLFIENLEKLSASGDLDTVEGARQAYVDAFGEEMSVSGGFVFNLTHKLFQRTDPFNRIVKNYEDKQDEMMRA
jgi:hypothetical protein